MLFNAQQFSKDLKIQKLNYQYQTAIDWKIIDDHIKALSNFPLETLITDAQKNAFWINVYNGLTNYIILKEPIKEQMKEMEGVFSKKVVTINSIPFSLDDIEHGILRRNARKKLPADHSILPLMVTQLDYRIHFALNCGAISCPPIAFYTPDNLEAELAMAEQAFVESSFLVDSVAKTIRCSEIFKWYREDFGGRFLDDVRYAGYGVSFMGYDWNI